MLYWGARKDAEAAVGAALVARDALLELGDGALAALDEPVACRRANANA